MQNRTLIRGCVEKIGTTVRLSGWVQTVRAHGKIAFLDLRDRSGLLQIGAFTSDLAKKVASLHSQDVVGIVGTVKKRGEKYINPDVAFGDIELEASDVDVLHTASEMPFDMGGKELHVELPTLLDYRSLTLKHQKVANIFIIQAALADEFRKHAVELDCTEVFVPTIAAGATEGGAEVFEIDYYGFYNFSIN